MYAGKSATHIGCVRPLRVAVGKARFVEKPEPFAIAQVDIGTQEDCRRIGVRFIIPFVNIQADVVTQIQRKVVYLRIRARIGQAAADADVVANKIANQRCHLEGIAVRLDLLQEGHEFKIIVHMLRIGEGRADHPLPFGDKGFHLNTSVIFRILCRQRSGKAKEKE